MKNLLGKKILIALVVLTIWQARTFGQPAYSQGFDSNGSQSPNGPANLVSEGWTFRNQSDNHLANAGWFDGDAFNQTPQAGSSCLYTASAQTIPFLQGGALSNWAILPEIPNQSAGSILTFFLFGSSAALGDQVLQVRFSPTGGTATGSNSASVGDFTQLLASFNTSPAWLQATVTLPGPGRIALRQMDPFVSNFPNGGVSLKVDSLTIASEATSPCGISLPQPGETVTWTQANSPYDVCSQLTIPRQGTVIVEPGVTISVQSGGPQLVIEGRLIAHGTSVSPIDFVGENFSIIDPPFEVSGGTLDMRFATVSARIQSKYGATILAADCDIPATGTPSLPTRCRHWIPTG
ncbi:MAG: choice-of-anchor J domain-containing protein [Planctomycetes bacterium]|nr:choice-of-anchor J domain-containing protein [Planctomycetota bacterium]